MLLLLLAIRQSTWGVAGGERRRQTAARSIDILCSKQYTPGREIGFVTQQKRHCVGIMNFRGSMFFVECFCGSDPCIEFGTHVHVIVFPAHIAVNARARWEVSKGTLITKSLPSVSEKRGGGCHAPKTHHAV